MQLLDSSLRVVKPEKDCLTLVNLVLPKLKSEDRVLDFFPYACQSSVFFQDAIAAQAPKSEAARSENSDSSETKKPTYICIPAKSSRQACEENIKNANVSIRLESRENLKSILIDFSPTVLLVDALEDAELLSLPDSLPDLRLVAYNTDKDKTNKTLPYLHSHLYPKGFHPHVIGKFTIFIKDDIPSKINEIARTPDLSINIIAILILIFCIVGAIVLIQFLRV
jgi:hypothetical protein